MKICWIHQMIVASGLDAIPGLSAWTERHVNRCPPCRQQAQAHQEIARKLSLCAPQVRRSASPFLHSRIMAAWDRELQEPIPVKQPGLPLWSIGVTSGCVALLALLIALHPSFGPPQETNLAESDAPLTGMNLPAESLLSNVSSVDNKVIDSLSKTLENPLEREMESMLQGARSAAQLLAQNFLPGSDVSIRFTRDF